MEKLLQKDKNLKIKFRITGDWKDHLNTKSRVNIAVYSSMLIKVIDDNYEGMTNLKFYCQIQDMGMTIFFGIAC